MTRCIIAVVGILSSALPALAQPPHLSPARDVTVRYRVTDPSSSDVRSFRVEHAASLGRERLRFDGRSDWPLLDRRAGQVGLVVDDTRSVTSLPSRAAAEMLRSFGTDPRFVRIGEMTVAGLACTDWTVTARHDTATACVTADGVTLRSVTSPFEGRLGTVIEAIEVSYGPVEAGRVTVPSAYEAMPVPADLPEEEKPR